MRLSLTPVLLAAALLLSGCVVEEVPTDATQPAQDPAPAADPPQQEPAPEEQAPDAPHGDPQVTEGAVESGTDVQQVPAAWARQVVTITNDANGADLVALAASVAAGGISVRTEARDGYLVEAVLEARAATEADARAQVERAHVVHGDALDGTTLTLEDHVEVDPPVAMPVPLPPGVTVSVGEAALAVHFTIVVPAGLPAQVQASSASGDLSVQDLAGPALELGTASGDIALSSLAVRDTDVSSGSGDVLIDGLAGEVLQVGTSSGDIAASGLAVRSVAASTSSGDIGLAGDIDDLDVGTSSGDVSVSASPAASGGYTVSTASGDVALELAGEAAYHVKAATASGDIAIDLPDGEVIEDGERTKEVASPGFDAAAVQTTVEVGTSSGDIAVQAS